MLAGCGTRGPAPKPSGTAPATGAPAPNTPARVVLSIDDADQRFLGENVLVHFCLENLTANALPIDVGGDYRFASRSTRFHVEARDAAGKPMPDPDPEPDGFGGLKMLGQQLEAGQRWCQSLPLHRYVRIDAAGRYVISATHDLGWPKGTPPTGETAVTLRMPSAAEAERVVRATEKDFSALRYPIYLEPLKKRAAEGDKDAVVGIGEIPSPAATEALLALLDSSSPEVANAAARALALRLPDPTFDAMAKEYGFSERKVAAKNYLRDAGWEARFEAALRVHAKKFLTADDEDRMTSGASLFGAIAKADDRSVLLDALGRAMTKTASGARDEVGRPPFRRTCQELAHALMVSRGSEARSPSPPQSLGEYGEWLAAARLSPDAKATTAGEATMHRALRHSNSYVRTLALAALATPIAPGFVADVGDCLTVRDPELRAEAIRILEDEKLVALGPKLVQVLRTADDVNTVLRAWRAADTLHVRYDAALALVGRLGDPKLESTPLDLLLGLFESADRAPSPVEPSGRPKLQAQWQAFVVAHRTDIAQGKKLDFAKAPSGLVP